MTTRLRVLTLCYKFTETKNIAYVLVQSKKEMMRNIIFCIVMFPIYCLIFLNDHTDCCHINQSNLVLTLVGLKKKYLANLDQEKLPGFK